MARRGIIEAKTLLLRGAKKAESGGTSQNGKKKILDSASCWVPHPRTGIYFPKGHEWVMDDVPEGAASFTHTFWLRNVDGVDNTKT